MTNQSNRMFCEYFARRPYSQDTRENSRLAWLFAFQSCALHVATSRVSFSQASREIHLFFILSLGLHTLSHSSLITNKNPHKYREKWLNKITIKFSMKLKPTQNNCKSQLYKNNELKCKEICVRSKKSWDIEPNNTKNIFFVIRKVLKHWTK